MKPLVRILVCAALLAIAVPSRAQVGEGLGACERAHEAPPGAPTNVELAGVNDTSFVVTWLTCSGGAPLETDGAVAYAELGSTATFTVTSSKSAFHNVRVTGLKPGTAYRYTVSSSGLTAPPDRFHPGAFTTLTPPGAREAVRVAVLADIHIGEGISGIASGDFPPGYTSEKDYSLEMLRGAVRTANASDVDLVLLPGDNTSHGDRHDLEVAKKELDRLHAPYLISRGAHDRGGQYDEAAAECPPGGDCFMEVFYPRSSPGPATFARAAGGWLFITLDSAHPETGAGRLDPDQLAWLDEQLTRAAAKNLPAVIFFHHPVAEYSSTLAVPPAVFGVEQQDAQEFLELIGRHDVRLVINAHTHRNWIAYSPHTGRMPIIETGPVKEYPAGVTLLRIYDEGLMREWLPVDCDFCNMWRETTRGEYMSLYPLYTLGSLRERNFVHRFDGPDVPGVPSIPLGLWPPLLAGEA